MSSICCANYPEWIRGRASVYGGSGNKSSLSPAVAKIASERVSKGEGYETGKRIEDGDCSTSGNWRLGFPRRASQCASDGGRPVQFGGCIQAGRKAAKRV